MKMYQCSEPNKDCGEYPCVVISNDLSAEPETCPYSIWSDKPHPNFKILTDIPGKEGWQRETKKGDK